MSVRVDYVNTHPVSPAEVAVKGKLRGIGRILLAGYIPLQKVPYSLISAVEKRTFTKLSYSWRDYIIPLGLLGSMFVPNDFFVYGWKCLVGEVFFHAILLHMLEKHEIKASLDEKNSKELTESHPFHTCISAPVVEECFYRGFLQNGLSLLTRSSTLGLLASSILFGLGHFATHNLGNYGKAISTGLGGLTLGLINHHFGMLNSIYAHCVFNSFACLLMLALSTRPINERIDGNKN